MRWVWLFALLATTGCGPAAESPDAEVSGAPLAARPEGIPQLHHVGLNSVAPDSALEWYRALWPSATPSTFAGRPALTAEMALVVNTVSEPPAGAFVPELGRPAAQSAIWHIGAFLDTTGSDRLAAAVGVEHLPLHLGPGGGRTVWRSGLAPYRGTHAAPALAEVEPADPREGGFSYLIGPDGALFELTGGPGTTPSFSHVHLFHEQPRCAARWYADVLGMERSGEAPNEDCEGTPAEAGWPSLEAIGTIRAPRATVSHEGGQLSIYPRQCVGDRCGEPQPLVPSRGQVLDHLGFEVDGLDDWHRWLAQEGVPLLEDLHTIDEGRAMMIEGPDGIAIELVEVERR